MTTKIKGDATSTFGSDIDVTGNVVTDAPAFSAYVSSNQTIANTTFTKMPLNIENFDTTDDFDNATDYKYTPSVEGYYLVKASAGLQTLGDGKTGMVAIYKNGTELQRGSQSANGKSDSTISIATRLVYMNGSTDNLTFYCYHDHGSSRNLLGQDRYANAEAVLVRAV
jgi:hypothetical protein